MEEKIEQLKAQAAEAIKNAAGNLSELDDIRVKFLGKKGEFTTILRGMGALAKEDRPKVGKIVNEAKAEIAQLIQQKNEELKARSSASRTSFSAWASLSRKARKSRRTTTTSRR